MRKNSIKILSVVLAIMMVLSCLPLMASAKSDVISGNDTETYQINSPSVVTLSDTHVYTEELVENGSKDYTDDVVKYNKLLGETFPILNAALKSIENSVKEKGLKYVFLTGDLTANGERKNHEYLAKLLRSFQNVMRTKYCPDFHIFVVPGNHDVSNYNATMYDKNGNSVRASSSKAVADELVTSSAQFAYIYRELGYGAEDALAGKIKYYNPDLGLDTFTEEKPCSFEDKYGNLTYSVDLTDQNGTTMRAVFIDGCEYAPEVSTKSVTIDGVEYPTDSTGGYMSEEQLDWICKESKDAVSKNIVPVGATHFATIPHFNTQAAIFRLFIYDNWQHVASKLADAGMHYYFSGHMHAPDISAYTSEKGETIYDIETGSVANYSNTYRENIIIPQSNGKIKFNSVSRACDSESKVDLSKVCYEYDNEGNPITKPCKYNLSADGKKFKEISKPFAENYGIYLFSGTRLKADDNGDSITTDASGNTILPSINSLAKNSVSGYLDGRTYENIIKNGGIKGIIEGFLGGSIKDFLDKNFDGDTVTLSVITVKKADIIKLADLLFKEIDSSYLGTINEDGSINRNNQKLLATLNALVDKLLDYKIGGYTLGEIAMQAIISMYNGGSGTSSKWFNIDLSKISADLDNDNAINGLIDYLINNLLGYATVDENGKEVQVKGILVDLLDELNLSIDMINSVLPDFAGILRYPALRTVLLGSASTTPSIINVADKWAKKIIVDKFTFEEFATGKTVEKTVTDTASLAEYFIFTTASDYLTKDQIHIVSTGIKNILRAFLVDETFTDKKDLDDSYTFVDNYDLKSLGLMSGKDNCAQIDYKPITPKTGADAWYQLPQTIAVTFGEDTKTQKNISWYTSESVTGTDVQLIPYKENASSADFTSSNLINASYTSSCKSQKMVYPSIDLGVWVLGEGTILNRHIAEISNLTAGTKYLYRVGDSSKSYWSSPAVLETSAGDSSEFTFFHMTDSQSQTKQQYDETYGKVLSNAFSSYSDAKFILHTGDMVDYGANMLQWQWALGQKNSLGTTIASTAGNHEPKGTNAKEGVLSTAFGTSQDTFFDIEHSEQDTTNGVFYDFDYNNVHFMVLNTNNLSDNNTLSAEQLQWLTESASKSNAEWKVVAMHKSIYSNGSHYKDSDVTALRNQLSKLMPELGIDIVFSGHDHVYVRTQAINSGKVSDTFDSSSNITNPTGTVYSINGKSGIKDYNVKNDELISKYFDISSCKQENVNNYSTYSAVSVKGGKLTVTSYKVNRENGEQAKIDSYSISKTKLASPENIKAVSASTSSVKISWSSVKGANAYAIYRADSVDGTYSKIATVSALSYTDKGLTTSKTYYYKVIAGTSANKSDFSATASAKATLSAVSNLRASKKTTSSIQVSWSKLALAKSYKVYISTSKDSGYKLAGTVVKPNYVVTSLTAGKTYYIKSCASDGSTDGQFTSPVAVKM